MECTLGISSTRGAVAFSTEGASLVSGAGAGAIGSATGAFSSALSSLEDSLTPFVESGGVGLASSASVLTGLVPFVVVGAAAGVPCSLASSLFHLSRRVCDRSLNWNSSSLGIVPSFKIALRTLFIFVARMMLTSRSA